MLYDIGDIQRDVRVCIDQNNNSSPLIEEADVDTLSLDEIIRGKIAESVRRVHLEAPAYLLEQGHNFGDGVYWDDATSGHVLLPEDFMRLIVFEMDDWERPVYTAISTEDPAYARQRSRHRGIRGTSQRPVCVISVRPEGMALEFYSCKSQDATVSKAMYVPEPKEEEGKIEISRRCYQAVIYRISAMTAMSLGAREAAEGFNELSKTELS